MKQILLAIGVVCALAAPAWADNDAAIAAHKRGDYQTAFAEFTYSAEQKDAGAQYLLGTMYALGQGVPRDYAEAVKWYGLAADQGLAEAQYSLGAAYKRGLGIAQDHAEAANWIYLAALQGSAEAQNQLGYMYFEGRGVPQNYFDAHMWFNFAAMAGLKTAEENLETISSFMTPEAISAAKILAYEWLDERSGE